MAKEMSQEIKDKMAEGRRRSFERKAELARNDKQRSEMQVARARSLFDLASKNNFRGLDENYYYRVFADYPGRLSVALESGYVFVTKDEVSNLQGFNADEDIGSRMSTHAGNDGFGKAMRAYLMRIPKDIWEMQEKARQEDVTSVESQIMGDASKIGQYRPFNGTKIEH